MMFQGLLLRILLAILANVAKGGLNEEEKAIGQDVRSWLKQMGQ